MIVSVALCTYNGERYLGEQLDSIFRQTYPVHEIVICDDRSSDSTAEIIREFQDRYPNVIQLHVNDQNIGGKKNFEKALSLCSGDVIFFSDQDDVWCENKVQVVVKTFKENPNCWGIGSDASLIKGDVDVPDSSFWESLDFKFEEINKSVKSSFCEYLLNYGNVVAGAMMSIRKEALPLIYPFKFMADMWHDEWIILSLSIVERFMLINEKLVRYRLHEGQQIGLGSANQASWLEYKKLLKDSDQLKMSPMLYFSHAWWTYDRFKRYENSMPELSGFKEVFKNRFQDAKYNLLKRENLLYRKARLMKWYINKEFDTSFIEVITL